MSGALLERYVDARELAKLMGVSERTIRRWVTAGMPSQTWGMARTRRFLPSSAIAWASSIDPPERRANVAGIKPRR
jgi:phage terminase Nu1 subunit (DNA packaging protein)